MAQGLKQIRNRIRSVEGTKKMTRAMEMVSSAKMRPLQRILFTHEEYFSRLSSLLFHLISGSRNIEHQLLERRKDKQRILLCIFTADTGLCGNYNSVVIRKAEEFISQNKNYQINLLVVGRKGLNYFKKRAFVIAGAYTELYGHFSSTISDKIAHNLTDMYLSGKVDEVYALYLSSPGHEPRLEKILNIEKENKEQVEYLTEPDPQNILEQLLPLYLEAKIAIILLKGFVVENSLRVMAMHEATDNAKELLDDLVILRNKVRQTNITEEIIDIISSVDAMKG